MNRQQVPMIRAFTSPPPPNHPIDPHDPDAIAKNEDKEREKEKEFSALPHPSLPSIP